MFNEINEIINFCFQNELREGSNEEEEEEEEDDDEYEVNDEVRELEEEQVRHFKTKIVKELNYK